MSYLLRIQYLQEAHEFFKYIKHILRVMFYSEKDGPVANHFLIIYLQRHNAIRLTECFYLHMLCSRNGSKYLGDKERGIIVGGITNFT